MRGMDDGELGCYIEMGGITVKRAEKYQRTLDYILGLDKDDHGLFQINWRDAMAALGISKKTVYRHLDKILEANGISIVYKGGNINPQLYQDILIDSFENPYTFTSSIYSIKECSQYQRDMAILRKVLRWRESSIAHYQWWSQAETLSYDENPNGLSEVTTKLLSQYVKYMIYEDFGYDDECYEVYMDKFELLRCS